MAEYNLGGSLDDFLKGEGILEEVEVLAAHKLLSMIEDELLLLRERNAAFTKIGLEYITKYDSGILDDEKTYDQFKQLLITKE